MSSKSNKKSSQNANTSTNKEDGSVLERLPFEPAQNSKKAAKKPASVPASKKSSQPGDQSPGKPSDKSKSPDKSKSLDKSKPSDKSTRSSAKDSTIPAGVSRRMVRRMAFFSGIPAFLGMATLAISYIIISNHWLQLPHVAVLLVNLGFFGLSVLGLSYGSISASWDEDRVGSWLGWNEFTTNFARLKESWRTAKQKPSP
ncbi:MAG: PAM68 family protein [Kovacikia sp.]